MNGRTARFLCLASLACSLASCKSIAPDVVENAAKEGSWYRYMPQHAPKFCLRTRHAIVWTDERLDLGYWRGRHPKAPHRVLMEARGHTFILHRRFVWDGNSIGPTTPADLMPSLRHDALYHALKEGAPICRKAIDQAYARDVKAATGSSATVSYAALRLFGGFYNYLHKNPNNRTMIIERTDANTPAVPLEPDHPDEDENPLDYAPPQA